MGQSTTDACVRQEQIAREMLDLATASNISQAGWDHIFQLLRCCPFATVRPEGCAYSLLHVAVSGGFQEAAHVLVHEFGADPHERTADGSAETAIAIAERRGFSALAAQLSKAGYVQVVFTSAHGNECIIKARRNHTLDLYMGGRHTAQRLCNVELVGSVLHYDGGKVMTRQSQIELRPHESGGIFEKVKALELRTAKSKQSTLSRRAWRLARGNEDDDELDGDVEVAMEAEKQSGILWVTANNSRGWRFRRVSHPAGSGLLHGHDHAAGDSWPRQRSL